MAIGRNINLVFIFTKVFYIFNSMKTNITIEFIDECS